MHQKQKSGRTRPGLPSSLFPRRIQCLSWFPAPRLLLSLPLIDTPLVLLSLLPLLLALGSSWVTSSIIRNMDSLAGKNNCSQSGGRTAAHNKLDISLSFISDNVSCDIQLLIVAGRETHEPDTRPDRGTAEDEE